MEMATLAEKDIAWSVPLFNIYETVSRFAKVQVYISSCNIYNIES